MARKVTRSRRAARGGPRRAARRRIRYAVVGQGWIAQEAILPGFANARRNSELVALVSDDPVKLKKLGRRYRVDRLCSYGEYEDCLKEGVDAVFIALPNSMHREYTVRAAAAGVHVLCEKPMAVTEADCRAMIEATRRAGVKLMIAYRLHFEPANLEAVRSVRSGRLGEPRIFSSVFTMQVEEGNVRLRAGEGGPLYDIGIYCLNAARYLFREEPLEAFATAARRRDPRFRECDETVSVLLRFPGQRLASFTCSFGAEKASAYDLVGTRAVLRVDPAYSHSGERAHRLTVGGRTRERRFPDRDQFGPEILYFSDCILQDREPQPSGWEGLADVRILQTLQRSIEAGRPQRIEPLPPPARPTPAQKIEKPARPKPPLVHADDPRPEAR